MSLRPGDTESIGGYALVDRLGSGGMGVVYLGRSASGRQVAVKVVHAQYALDEEFRPRFRQEIAAVRRGERRLHRARRGRRRGRRGAVDGHAVRARPHAGRSRREGRPVDGPGPAHARPGPGRGAAGHPPSGRRAPGLEAEQCAARRGRPPRHRLRHLPRRRQPDPHRHRPADRHPALHVPGAVRGAPGRHGRLRRLLPRLAARLRGHRQPPLRRRQPVLDGLSGHARAAEVGRRGRAAAEHRRALSGQGRGGPSPTG